MAKLYIKNTDGTFAPHSSIAVTKLDVVQSKGDSLTSVMSQKSVSDELAKKQDNSSDTDGGYGQRVAELETGKADKATTLAGYGITNAYTKSEVDAAIASAITTTLNTEV